MTPAFYPALVYGGPVRSLYDLCRALADAGEEVRVLTTDANGAARIDEPREVAARTEAGGVFHVRYARRTAGPTVSAALVRALPHYVRWADVVHITAVYSFPTLPALLAARLARRHVVLSPRGSFGPWGQAQRRWAKRPLNVLLRALAASGVTWHATAESEGADIRRSLGPVPTVVVPNGVDAGEFAVLPADSGVWCRLAVRLQADDGPLIGYLGRVHPKKGLERLVRALPPLLSRWRRAQALVAGPADAAEQARLTGIARDLGVDAHLHFLRPMYGSERIAFLAGLDVFVLPSFDENFANAVAESLAAGTPVVASRQCPWPELEEHGCGRWIDACPETVATAIASILAGDGAAMGRCGREFVLKQRTVQLTAERLRQVYRRVGRHPLADGRRGGVSR